MGGNIEALESGSWRLEVGHVRRKYEPEMILLAQNTQANLTFTVTTIAGVRRWFVETEWPFASPLNEKMMKIISLLI